MRKNARRTQFQQSLEKVREKKPYPNKTSTPLKLEDFWALMPQHAYIFVPSRELWPTASVNGRVNKVKTRSDLWISPARWLDEHRAVEQMTWAPGLPELVSDRLVAEGGWIIRPGCSCFNLYLPPHAVLGDPGAAGPWLNHLTQIFPDAADHIVQWLAHRVQYPGIKINHALVLSGAQGIGKDTLLEPVKQAVGPWNFREIGPKELIGRFNGFVKAVILRINEARDLGDIDRFSFYEHCKVYTAAPPDVLRCDEKNLREYAVFNVCGVIITTNHKEDGLYLPADDRRHFVAWSDRTRSDFGDDYFRNLYGWLANGGNGHVAAYLQSVDLSHFDPKAPPPKTSAFWDIVDANRAPEAAELGDALERLGKPLATTVDFVAAAAEQGFREWLKDRRNARQVPRRFEAAGYSRFRNQNSTDGRFKIDGRNQTVYVQSALSPRDRSAAVGKLMGSAL